MNSPMRLRHSTQMTCLIASLGGITSDSITILVISFALWTIILPSDIIFFCEKFELLLTRTSHCSGKLVVIIILSPSFLALNFT